MGDSRIHTASHKRGGHGVNKQGDKSFEVQTINFKSFSREFKVLSEAERRRSSGRVYLQRGYNLSLLSAAFAWTWVSWALTGFYEAPHCRLCPCEGQILLVETRMSPSHNSETPEFPRTQIENRILMCAPVPSFTQPLAVHVNTPMSFRMICCI